MEKAFWRVNMRNLTNAQKSILRDVINEELQRRFYREIIEDYFLKTLETSKMFHFLDLELEKQ